jgi:hypothetical protein
VLQPVALRLLTLEPSQQRHRLQAGLLLKQLLQLWPNIEERIRTRSPVARCGRITGKLAKVPILPCGFTIHVCLHRCLFERCLPIEVATQFLDLCIRDLAAGTHWQLLLLVEMPT